MGPEGHAHSQEQSFMVRRLQYQHRAYLPGLRVIHGHGPQYQHRAYLPGLKVVLDTVLEPLPFRLERRDDQTVAHKVRRVAHPLVGAEAADRDRWMSGYAMKSDRAFGSTCQEAAVLYSSKLRGLSSFFVVRQYD